MSSNYVFQRTGLAPLGPPLNVHLSLAPVVALAPCSCTPLPTCIGARFHLTKEVL